MTNKKNRRVLNVSLPADDYEYVEFMANELDVTKSKAVRMLIQDDREKLISGNLTDHEKKILKRIMKKLGVV